ncbi:hypothetical protein ACFWM1_13185 [Nocardia sp. NPDC058379]|uniref:hypothetical protein n=1 Tax=unclassified Nocardia TaxID=2637762 RepID=UPI003650AEA6
MQNETLVGGIGARIIDHWALALGCVAVALFGLAVLVHAAALAFNGVAFLTGHGTVRTVYIESVRAVSGDDLVSDVDHGDGYYLDAEGQRHGCAVRQWHLEPGTQVQARSPMIPVVLPLDPHNLGVFYNRLGDIRGGAAVVTGDHRGYLLVILKRSGTMRLSR